MPADIWSGRHGGFPSITVNPQAGVSVALPAPHAGLTVQVALMKPANRPAADASGTGFYDVSGYVTVTIDYEPVGR